MESFIIINKKLEVAFIPEGYSHGQNAEYVEMLFDKIQDYNDIIKNETIIDLLKSINGFMNKMTERDIILVDFCKNVAYICLNDYEFGIIYENLFKDNIKAKTRAEIQKIIRKSYRERSKKLWVLTK